MTTNPTNILTICDQLVALRAELVELAYTLDCRRQPEAADVATTVAARIAELCAELVPAKSPADSPPARSEVRNCPVSSFG